MKVQGSVELLPLTQYHKGTNPAPVWRRTNGVLWKWLYYNILQCFPWILTSAHACCYFVTTFQRLKSKGKCDSLISFNIFTRGEESNELPPPYCWSWIFETLWKVRVWMKFMSYWSIGGPSMNHFRYTLSVLGRVQVSFNRRINTVPLTAPIKSWIYKSVSFGPLILLSFHYCLDSHIFWCLTLTYCFGSYLIRFGSKIALNVILLPWYAYFL